MPIIIQGGGISFDGGFSLGPTIPPPPIIGTATLSNTTASVPFTAPNNDGGEPITSYTAVSTPGSLTNTLNQSTSGVITIANLSYDTTYSFIVYATNKLGNSTNSSPSNSIYVPTQLQTTLAVASKTTVQNVSDPFTPVTASGGQLPYTFSVSPSLPSGMNLNTGNGQITGAPTVTSSSTSYTVTVTDAVSQTSDKTFALQVNSPVSATLVIASKTLNQNTGVGTPFTPVTGANGLTPYVYSISPSLPSGLSINTGNGSISGTPTVTQTSTNHTVTITDAYSQTANNTFALLVNTELTTTQAIASRQLEQNYSINLPFTPVTASGGTTPYTFSVSPTVGTGSTVGLSFSSSNGEISGTPTSTLGTTTYTVTATDDIGATSSKTFNLNIAAALTTTLAVPTVGLTINVAMSATTPVTASNGISPYTFAVSPSLPSGLSFNTGNGEITGTPTVLSSSTSYTVTVTDSLGATSNKSFSLSVGLQQFVITIDQQPRSISSSYANSTSDGYLVVAGGNSPANSFVLSNWLSNGTSVFTKGYPANTNQYTTYVSTERYYTLPPSSQQQYYSATLSANNTSFFNGQCSITKWSSTGTITWQRLIDNTTTNAMTEATDLTADTTGVTTVFYNASNSTTTGVGIVKFHANGATAFQRNLFPDSLVNYPRRLSADNGNVFLLTDILNNGANSAGGMGSMFTKFSSTGTTTWQRTIQSGTAIFIYEDVETDLNNNIYGGSRAALVSGGNNYGVISSFDSGGTVRWHRAVQKLQCQSLVYIPSTDILLAYGPTGTPSNGLVYIVALNCSTGSVSWVTEITCNPAFASFSFWNITEGGNGTLYCQVDNDILNLQADGTSSGTVTTSQRSYAIASVSLDNFDATSNVTVATPSAITNVTAGYTITTPAVTASNPTVTQTKTNIT